MKHIFTALITRSSNGWWELRTSEGDPPTERTGHYLLRTLLELLHIKTQRVKENQDAAEVKDVSHP